MFYCMMGNQIVYVKNMLHFLVCVTFLENAAYFSREKFGYPSYNKTSLYLEKIFSALNCSTDSLVH